MNKYISIAFLIMFMGWGSALAQTDYDMFMGHQEGNVAFYERQNSGAGSFSFSLVTGSSNPLDDVDTWKRAKPEFADIDNDGDMDCFVGTTGGAIEYWKNTGNSTSATFVEWDGNAESADPNPFYGVDDGSWSEPAFVNIDGDASLPVELTSFNVLSTRSDAVILQWVPRVRSTILVLSWTGESCPG